MLIDKRSTFARDLSIPAAGGPSKFGEALPLSVRANQGVGEPMYLYVACSVAASGGTSVALELVTADDEALTTNVTSLLTLGTYPLASLTAGAQLYAAGIPMALYRVWLGLRHTTVGTFSAGKINAFLINELPAWRAYANNNQ